jgi:hypothetical protein
MACEQSPRDIFDATSTLRSNLPTADNAHERARELILRFGWNATAYQILNPGIELWFSRSGDGVVGFVRHHRTRVVAGAPIRDHSQRASVAALPPPYCRSIQRRNPDAAGRTRFGKGRAAGSRSTVQANFTYGYCRRV